jgi:hypothetical protein
MTPPRYLPPELVARMRHVLPSDLPPALRGLINELIEDGYAWGYVDGCDRGADAGYVPAAVVHSQRRVGVDTRFNGPIPAQMAAHPSAVGYRSNGHSLEDRDPASVTPLRHPIGQIGDGVEQDLLDRTDQLDPPHNN